MVGLMDLTTGLVVAAVVAAVLLLKRAAQINPAAARALLGSGARVIDVRTRGEFAGAHLESAINIPLDELKTQAPAQLPDKNQPLLLHCLSGTRSLLAARVLKRLGYAQVYNLGSFRRARRIVEGR